MPPHGEPLDYAPPPVVRDRETFWALHAAEFSVEHAAELGAGRGENVVRIGSFARNMTGFESRPADLAAGAARVQGRRGLAMKPLASFPLPVGPGSLDLVIVDLTRPALELPPRRALWSEARRALGDGGTLGVLAFGPSEQAAARIAEWLGRLREAGLPADPAPPQLAEAELLAELAACGHDASACAVGSTLIAAIGRAFETG